MAHNHSRKRVPAHTVGGDYVFYLIAIPGPLQSEINGLNGARLLEQNVRTFLQATGGGGLRSPLRCYRPRCRGLAFGWRLRGRPSGQTTSASFEACLKVFAAHLFRSGLQAWCMDWRLRAPQRS